MEVLETLADTCFAAVSRDDYLRIRRRLTGQEAERQIAFLHSIPLLSGLSPYQTRKTSEKATQQSFQRHQFIFTQGELPTHVYVVCEGEIELLRNKKSKYKLIDPLNHNRARELQGVQVREQHSKPGRQLDS